MDSLPADIFQMSHAMISELSRPGANAAILDSPDRP
jgi:hypothetical protein